MNARLLRPFPVLAAIFLLAAAPTAVADPPKWEYLAVNAAVQTVALERLLNARGAEGWELVGFTRKDVAVFKRRAR